MSHPGRIAELRIAAEPGAWAAAGFGVRGERLELGSTTIAFDPGEVPERGGIAGWSLSGVGGGELDGLPTSALTAPEGGPPRPAVTEPPYIDHVVVFSAGLERTVAAFEAAGIPCRRVREPGDGSPGPPVRQAFFRLGETLIELVEVPAGRAGPQGRARFWGLTVAVADLEGRAAALGELCGSVRDAVQPGRRIATIRREAGLGLPVALISPPG